MKESTKQTLTTILWIISIFLFGWSIGWGMRGEIQPTQEEVIEKEVVPQLDTLGDWEVLQMAIVMTESQFNPEAVGTSKDWGIFQITPVYVREVNRILKEDVYSHEDAFDIGKSIEMFSTMQSHYNPQQDLDTALRYHNKAGWYKKKVKDNISLIKRMEEVRRQLKSSRDI